MGISAEKGGEEVPLDFTYQSKHYSGRALPLKTSCLENFCHELDVQLNGEYLGTIYCGNDKHWTLPESVDQDFVNRIGEEIALWYGSSGLSGELSENLG